MSHRKICFVPQAEPLEPRLTLSTVMPTLTTPAYRAALADVRSVLGSLAKTGNYERAESDLTQAAARIPYGKSRLLPVWQAKLSAISPGAPGSGLRAQRQMLLALNAHLHRGLKASILSVRGPTAAGLSRPRLDSLDRGLLFVNETARAIEVTLTDVSSTRILFASSIPGNSSLYFDDNPPSSRDSLLPPLQAFEVSATIANGPRVRLLLAAPFGKTVLFLERPGQLIAEVEETGFPGGG